MYVAAPIGDRVVEGYVDLLVRTAGRPGRGRLQDRPARHRRRAVDARAESYRLQLAAYAAAVEAATGERVARGVLVFVGARDPIAAVERAFERVRTSVSRASRRCSPGSTEAPIRAGVPGKSGLRVGSWSVPHACHRSGSSGSS